MKIYHLLSFLIVILFNFNVHAQNNLDSVIVDITKNTYDSNIVPPRFNGSDVDYGKFIADNFHHPSPEKENNVGGQVLLDVIVEKDGTLSSITVKQSATKNIDDELIRVIKLMPKYIPGTKDGKAARFRIRLNMTFNTK